MLVVAPTGSGKTLAAFLAALDRLASTPAARGAEEALPRAVRVAAEGPGRRRGAQSPQPADRDPAGVRPPRPARAGHPGRDPLRRHPARRAAVAGHPPAGHPDHHARVAVPDAHLRRPGRPGGHRDGDPGRGARGRGDQARRTPRALPGAAGRAAAAPGAPDRAVGDGPAGGRGRPATSSPRGKVEIVQPPSAKEFDLSVVVPVQDMGELGGSPATEGREGGDKPSIWPHVEERIADLVQAHRSTIVFANSRRLAERLCNRLNEIAYERAMGETLPEGPPPAEIMAQSGAAHGAPPLLARAHHGSVSKEQRALVEEDLKAGRLPAVVATSSLELGIDMGAVDLVVQVESPPSVASGLQRVGRAGHQVGAVSTGRGLPQVPRRPGAGGRGHRADAHGCDRVPARSPRTRWTYWRSSWSPWSRWTPGSWTTSSRWCAGRRPSRRCPSRRSPPCWTCWPAAIRRTRSPSSGRAWSGTGWRGRSPAGRGPSASRSPRAAPSRTADCSGSSSPDRTRRRAAAGSASSTRRWSTSPASGTSSPWAPPRGASRTSPATGCWSPPPPGCRAGCRSGRATSSAARSNWAARSARSCASSAASPTRTPGCGCWRPAWTPGPRRTCWRTSPSSARPAATSRTTGPSWWSGSATSWATGGSWSIRRSAHRCTPRGRWR